MPILLAARGAGDRLRTDKPLGLSQGGMLSRHAGETGGRPEIRTRTDNKAEQFYRLPQRTVSA